MKQQIKIRRITKEKIDQVKQLVGKESLFNIAKIVGVSALVAWRIKKGMYDTGVFINPKKVKVQSNYFNVNEMDWI